MKELRTFKAPVKVALVDDQDFERCRVLNWYHSCGYLETNLNGRNIFLHRFILNPPEHLWVDHEDRNRLNNQRYNLRIVTPSINNMRNLTKNKFRWVSYCGSMRKYYNRVKVSGGKRIILGYHKTPLPAFLEALNFMRINYPELSNDLDLFESIALDLSLVELKSLKESQR